MSIVVSILMGCLLGFAAHRAWLCTVKAVAEVVTARRAHFLWSFIKSAWWVIGLTSLAATIPIDAGLRHWPAGGVSVMGGILFGIGAGLNGGCTFSTLSRTIDGNQHALAAVLMWPVGILAGLTLIPDIHGAAPGTVPAGRTPLWLSVPIGLVLLRELVLLWRRMRHAGSVRRFLGAPVYTLSAAAVLLGGANGVLLLSKGPWSFTGTLLCAMQTHTMARCTSPTVPLLVLLAVLSGMALSCWQRGSFRLQRPQPREMARHAAGGMLMGVGAVFIPGGNDGLILFGIPSLSPHAIPAYLGILAGIAAVLMTVRAMGHALPKPSVITCAAQLLKVLGVDGLTEGSFMPPSTK